MLDQAIEAFNNIAQREIGEIDGDLNTIRAYLSDQLIRSTNTINGCEHLNREMDVVARVKAKIIGRFYQLAPTLRSKD